MKAIQCGNFFFSLLYFHSLGSAVGCWIGVLSSHVCRQPRLLGNRTECDRLMNNEHFFKCIGIAAPITCYFFISFLFSIVSFSNNYTWVIHQTDSLNKTQDSKVQFIFFFYDFKYTVIQ